MIELFRNRSKYTSTPSMNSRKARNKSRNACFRAITAANEARVVGDEAAKGPAGDKTSHEHCTRGKHTTTTSAEFCRAQLRPSRALARVCVHYTEAWNNAVPLMAKEEAVESLARFGFYRFVQRGKKVY